MHVLLKHFEDVKEPPVVIGALGGSGTRVVTSIVRDAGWWMGGRVIDATEDSLPMSAFLNRWFEALLDFPDVPPGILNQALADFRKATDAHREGIRHPDAPWGWKNPRNMWLVPFYAFVFKGMKFIHLIRDGRDMSLSANRFLLETHGPRLLGPEWMNNPVAAQMELWRIGNPRAADSAALLPPGHYLLLRYEELCSKPRETVPHLLNFLGVGQGMSEELVGKISPSDGIGRWRGVGGAEMAALTSQAKDELERFGYET